MTKYAFAIWVIVGLCVGLPVVTALVMIWAFSATAWTQGNFTVLAVNTAGSLAIFGGLAFVAYMVRVITRG